MPRRNDFVHDDDHNFCPYTCVRRSEWFLRCLHDSPVTSPFQLRYLLSSHSIKNAFMFFPPPNTYNFVPSPTRGGRVTVAIETSGDMIIPVGDTYRVSPAASEKGGSSSTGGRAAGAGGPAAGAASDKDGGNAWTYNNARSATTTDADPRSPHDASPSSSRAATLEVIFIPWTCEFQAYRVEGVNVVMESRVRVGHSLYRFSPGCYIPSCVVRPHRRKSSHVILAFHCNGDDIGGINTDRLSEIANALHATLICPEYPGYGLLLGSTSEATVKAAAERIVQFLLSVNPDLTPSRLILLGHSIGTAVVMHIAAYIERVFAELEEHYRFPCSHCNVAALDAAVVPPPPAHPPRSAREQHHFAPHRRTCPRAHDGGSGGDEDQISDREEEGEEERREGWTRHCTAEVNHEPADPPSPPRRPSTATRASSAAPGNIPENPYAPYECLHNRLGGIVLISAFASVRCVEWVHTLKRTYHLVPEALELRRLALPTDTVVPAPQSWAEPALEYDKEEAAAKGVDMSFNNALLLFSRFASFDRFASIDVAADLQERRRYFNATPLLLVHGSDDDVILPVHSAAIASAVRRANGGDAARVFLAMLGGQEHNGIRCVRQVRRFYKDQILMPHLRRQCAYKLQLEKELQEAEAARAARRHPFQPAMAIATAPDRGPELPATATAAAAAGGPLFSPDATVTADALDRSDDDDSLPPGMFEAEPRLIVISKAAMPAHPLHESEMPSSLEGSTLSRIGPGWMSELRRTANAPTSFVPVASLLHWTSLGSGDPSTLSVSGAACAVTSTDVGSLCVLGLLSQAPTISEACRSYHHQRRITLALHLLRFAGYLVFPLLNLALGVAHMRLTTAGAVAAYLPAGAHPSDLRADPRVMVWAVLTFCTGVILSVVFLVSPMWGLAYATRRDTSGAIVAAYHICYGVGMLLSIGAGILMGFILALAPAGRGGVDWARWGPLPYSRRVWVVYLPRWMMVAMAIVSLISLIYHILKNH